MTDNLDTGLVADVKLEGALEGLVAHWTFDDAQGSTAAESINGLNGTLTGFDDPEAAWVAGKSGTALKFEGTGGHIVIPSSEKLNLQTLTVSAWINASNYAQDGFIFEKTVGGSINTHFSLYLQGSDELNFRIVQGGTSMIPTYHQVSTLKPMSGTTLPSLMTERSKVSMWMRLQDSNAGFP